ncbi:EAL domain-containing protein [Marinimicrobium alkaliphilum]|uniref:EAL domain-containing protein n=1 Tax=Marinimicrobium alkaliphilum TaxID=2202654 RepID=UPI000DBAA3C8|nr:EAL domain-containing protein [Marinimicrobium alkaliphilum]
MPDTPVSQSAPARLLILDDDALTGETIQRIATYAGFDVLCTANADDFLARVNDWVPDIIALDLIMPDMDGVEVMAELAKHQCQARIIITSGVGSRVLDAAGRSARGHGLNIAGILPKPFSAGALRELLNTAVGEGGQLTDHQQQRAQAERALTLNDLRDAIATRQIHLAYQPKVACHTGTLSGFEALARWHHPELGFIAPDTFIPMAEESGLIDTLTAQLAEEALDWLAGLSSKGPVTALGSHLLLQVRLSLNISAHSLANKQLFDDISQRCRQLGIDPQRVVLELTETSAMHDATASLDNLTRLRMQGFHLSIDDFGTGYSSMLQLVRLPFSEIKVDKSFVMTAADSEESRVVIRSIVELGRSLKLSTTAEGIEDASTLAYLRELRCDLAQGYHVARPMPAEAVLPWITEREQARERDRIAALKRLKLLDTPDEARFDRFTRLAQRLFHVPMALITLLDENRQWFKSRQGLSLSETPRSVAFCSKAIETDEMLIVADASRDPRFRDNPYVQGPPHVRFYAGQPLCTPEGHKVGTLCVMDSEVRMLSPQDQKLLRELGLLLEQELALNARDATDQTTGLVSKSVFRRQADAAFELCKRLDLSATFISLQLSSIALTNQALGRDQGDAIIQEAGRILAQVAGSADILGRYRGTEVAAIQLEMKEKDALTLAQHLNAYITEWNNDRPSENHQIHCEIGIAYLKPNANETLTDALTRHWRPIAMVS